MGIVHDNYMETNYWGFEKMEMPLILFIYLCIHMYIMLLFPSILFVTRIPVIFNIAVCLNTTKIYIYIYMYVCSLLEFSHFLLTFSHYSTNTRVSELVLMFIYKIYSFTTIRFTLDAPFAENCVFSFPSYRLRVQFIFMFVLGLSQIFI